LRLFAYARVWEKVEQGPKKKAVLVLVLNADPAARGVKRLNEEKRTVKLRGFCSLTKTV
jgi:hypothetical protein